jgi:hypothetical protein
MIQWLILISNHVKAIAGIGGLDSRSPQTHREVASNVFFRIVPHRTAKQVSVTGHERGSGRGCPTFS